MAWDHSHLPSRQHHLYPVQGELLTGPFFPHTNRTHLLLENQTHPIRRMRNSHENVTNQVSSFSKGLVTPSSKQKYESLSPVDVVVFSLPSKDISYQNSWFVVSVTIFTSCDIFCRSRRASPNTNYE